MFFTGRHRNVTWDLTQQTTKRSRVTMGNAQSRATFCRHSAVLSLPAVLLRKVCIVNDTCWTFRIFKWIFCICRLFVVFFSNVPGFFQPFLWKRNGFPCPENVRLRVKTFYAKLTYELAALLVLYSPLIWLFIDIFVVWFTSLYNPVLRSDLVSPFEKFYCGGLCSLS